MKNLLKYALIVVISAWMFGCSSDNYENEAAEMPEVSVSAEQLAEDAAFAELFKEIDALNAKYQVANNEQEDITRAKDKPVKTIKRAAIVIACDALGAGTGALLGGPWIGGITGVAASIWAACHWKELDENFILQIKFSYLASCDAYLSSFSSDNYDKIGIAHNDAIVNLLKTNTLESLNDMTISQFTPKIYSALQSSQYMSFPPNYNPSQVYIAMQNIQNMLQKYDYDAIKILNYHILSNPANANYLNTIKKYISGLNTVSDENIASYNRDFRNTVENSSISAAQKQNIRTSTSVGFASSNLWYYEAQ
ncbi:MAG TPA: hypothetical protein H9866_04760 [Candidatus Tidjanibacter gallistercoris]|nr:hypothetical protein [Candidatus Tidjanibacter gallistercoris]